MLRRRRCLIHQAKELLESECGESVRFRSGTGRFAFLWSCFRLAPHHDPRLSHPGGSADSGTPLVVRTLGPALLLSRLEPEFRLAGWFPRWLSVAEIRRQSSPRPASRIWQILRSHSILREMPDRNPRPDDTSEAMFIAAVRHAASSFILFILSILSFSAFFISAFWTYPRKVGAGKSEYA